MGDIVLSSVLKRRKSVEPTATALGGADVHARPRLCAGR